MKAKAQDWVIEDLNPSNRDRLCICLEDWSDDLKEVAPVKKKWCSYMEEKGLGAKLARNSEGKYLGMVQYLPAEYSSIEGEGLYFIQCVWIPKGKEVQGDYRKQGIGKALLQAAEEDIRSRGAKGIAAWGVSIPVWMKASWYRKQGYVRAQKEGIMELVWKPFSSDAQPPVFRKPRVKPQNGKAEGKVLVHSYVNGLCPAMNLGAERARRAVQQAGERVEYSQTSTLEAKEIAESGMVDALFINGKEMPLGPPPSEKKILKAILREKKKLKKEANP